MTFVTAFFRLSLFGRQISKHRAEPGVCKFFLSWTLSLWPLQEHAAQGLWDLE